jgi:CubicO group peptidase (beta-lactamase class C family)
MLADFADAPLNANHGKSFDYSNGNFATLAAVVERLSGLTYDEYLKRNVWGPAGMRLPDSGHAIGYARFSEHDPLGVEPRRPETVRGGTGKSKALGFGGGAYTAEDCSGSRARCRRGSSCRRRSPTASRRARCRWAGR